MDWFLGQTNAEGLFAFDWEFRDQHLDESGRPYVTPIEWVRRAETAADLLVSPTFNVFIDHPGMGWHNVEEPGIDRRGCNAAMNALLVIALRALAELEEACGEAGADELRRRAGALAAVAARKFWNAREGAFVDGVRGGCQLEQVSQQTNTWCVLAGFCSGEQARAVLRRILDGTDAKLARSGPYFWTFMLPALAGAGMLGEALAEVERLWWGMIERDATTSWETFSGDELDSLCHPWSCAPIELLSRWVAGVGALPSGASVIEVRPQVGLVRSVRCRVMTCCGPVSIAWERVTGQCELSGSLPQGVTRRLHLPDVHIVEVQGNWQAASLS